MDYAIGVVFLGAIAVGVVSAVVRTWSLHRRVYTLEDRLTVMEGIVTREVKTRAGQERWKKADQDAALLSSFKAAPSVTRKKNWWEIEGVKP